MDVLSFTPGAAIAATFTRDGQPLDDAQLLLEAGSAARGGGARVANGVAAAVGRLRSVVGGSSEAIDERALRRRRRLRRMVDGIEALEAESELARTGAAAAEAARAGDEAGGEDGATSNRLLGRELLEQLVSFADLDPDDSVLELECGSGHLAAALLHYLRYGSYIGLDASAESVSRCTETLTPRNPRFTFSRWDSARPLPCKDESLDFVLAEFPTRLPLSELARVLRDGGAVFLTTTPDDALSDSLAQAPLLTIDRTSRGAVVLRRGR